MNVKKLNSVVAAAVFACVAAASSAGAMPLSLRCQSK